MTPIMKPMYDSIYETYALCMTPIMKLMYDSNYETCVWLHIWNLCMTPIVKPMYDSNYETYVWLHMYVSLLIIQVKIFHTFFKDIPAYLTHLCPIFGLVCIFCIKLHVQYQERMLCKIPENLMSLDNGLLIQRDMEHPLWMHILSSS